MIDRDIFNKFTGLTGISRPVSRRSFLRYAASAVAAGTAAVSLPRGAVSSERFEARYYEPLGKGRVRCLLCPRKCVIPGDKTGYCGVRKNIGGRLYSLIYGEACSIHSDPIEKKPFFHVMPGTRSLSVSTVGCNLECKFCQNWQISQSKPGTLATRYIPPQGLVDMAIDRGIPSVTFTYGEPVVFIEYAQDIAARARENGLKSFVVTNGYYREKPLDDLCGLVDAVKVDLKSFKDSYYKDICDGNLGPVLDSIVRIKSKGVWLELVYLMLPTLNDSPDEIRGMAKWLVANLGPDVPLHFSRFFPQYKLKNLPPTPIASLKAAHDVCRDEGLKFVYIGNVPGEAAENTFCPSCSEKIIERSGFRIGTIRISEGKCENCGETIPGLWGDI